jgi:hypothetical protein
MTSDIPANDTPATDAAAPVMRRKTRKPSAKKRAERKGLVDIGAILNEPVEILKNGKVGKMAALEVAIRKQVKKALTEKSLPAVMAVIKIAIDNDLVAPPSSPAQGGVFILPKFVSEEDQYRIFTERDDMSMKFIFDILRPYYEQQQDRRASEGKWCGRLRQTTRPAPL